MSDYVLCILRYDDKPVFLRPGARGEHDLIERIVAETVKQGVGIFRTEAHVRTAVEQAVRTVLREAKSEVLAT